MGLETVVIDVIDWGKAKYLLLFLIYQNLNNISTQFYLTLNLSWNGMILFPIVDRIVSVIKNEIYI